MICSTCTSNDLKRVLWYVTTVREREREREREKEHIVINNNTK